MARTAVEAEAAAIAKRAAANLQAWAAAGDGSARPVLSVTDGAEADAKIENAKRVLETARLAMAGATPPLEKAQLRVSHLSARTTGIVLAVIQEEADAALDRLRHARKIAAGAEATVRGLIDFLGEQGRDMFRRGAPAELTAPLLRAAEKITHTLNALSPAAPEIGAAIHEAGRWAALMDQLAANAGARLEEAR